MEYLIHPLLDEGRIREPKSRSVLRACKFARQPEESGAQFAQGQALPFFRVTCPLKSRDQVVGQPNYIVQLSPVEPPPFRAARDSPRLLDHLTRPAVFLIPTRQNSRRSDHTYFIARSSNLHTTAS